MWSGCFVVFIISKHTLCKPFKEALATIISTPQQKQTRHLHVNLKCSTLRPRPENARILCIRRKTGAKWFHVWSRALTPHMICCPSKLSSEPKTSQQMLLFSTRVWLASMHKIEPICHGSTNCSVWCTSDTGDLSPDFLWFSISLTPRPWAAISNSPLSLANLGSQVCTQHDLQKDYVTSMKVRCLSYQIMHTKRFWQLFSQHSTTFIWHPIGLSS